MGGYERDPAPWSLDGIPPDFNGKLLDEDWPRFEPLLENAVRRVPALEEMEVVKLINGPRGVHAGRRVHPRPDRRARLLGRGRLLRARPRRRGRDGEARCGVDRRGTPSLDVWHMDSRRFGAAYRSREYTLARTTEVYSTYYDVKYPGHEREAGRPLRVSPTYARLQALGAVWGEKSGWERANWFEPNAAEGDESLRPRGWAGKLWSPAIGAEHRACREAVALFDESSFAKIEVSGRAARIARAPLREPGRARRGRDHLHPDAERPRRDRVRLHGHAPRRGAFPDRHRNRVRAPRPRLDPPARARGRLGPRGRRHLAGGLPRPLGAGGREILAPLTTDPLDFPYLRAASSRSVASRASRSA